MLVGLIGPIGSGKSTVAKHLVEAYDFERLPLAKRLKEMGKAFGLSDAQVYGADKQVPTKWVSPVTGKMWTPREFMQWLGTNFGRDMLGKNIWVDLWTGDVLHLRSLGYHVVADDVRFANEVEAVRNLGGAVIRVLRPSEPLGEFAAHASETEATSLGGDFLLVNDGSISDLCAKVDQIVEYCLVRSAAE